MGTCYGWDEMTQEFLAGVHSIVEPLLIQLGFYLDEVDDSVDEGGRRGSVVFYRSKDCKIQVYDSSREGSINCMIAPLDASNVFGPYDRSKKWQYLPRYAIWQGVPLEEIMKDNLPIDFPTTSQFLESVRRRIEKYYPVAHAGVLEMYGDE
jgi:hypothetical protein